jgi:RloB-like protein
MTPDKGRRKPTARRPRTRVQYETDLTRTSGVREQRRTILIVTNGQRTEADYFEGLRLEPWVTAALRVKYEGVAPNALPAKAAFLRDSNDYDAVWIVCDVDEFDVVSAVAQAADNKVGIALSNPCFEVWLLLHVSSKCGGFNNCGQVQRALKRHFPAWDKSRLNFADFRDGVTSAVERAKRLDQSYDANPSTAVWRIVEDLASTDGFPEGEVSAHEFVTMAPW